jgi:hypothetical protein
MKLRCIAPCAKKPCTFSRRQNARAVFVLLCSHADLLVSMGTAPVLGGQQGPQNVGESILGRLCNSHRRAAILAGRDAKTCCRAGKIAPRVARPLPNHNRAPSSRCPVAMRCGVGCNFCSSVLTRGDVFRLLPEITVMWPFFTSLTCVLEVYLQLEMQGLVLLLHRGLQVASCCCRVMEVLTGAGCG